MCKQNSTSHTRTHTHTVPTIADLRSVQLALLVSLFPLQSFDRRHPFLLVHTAGRAQSLPPSVNTSHTQTTTWCRYVASAGCTAHFSLVTFSSGFTSICGQSVGMPGPWLFFHQRRSSSSLMDMRVWCSSLYTAFTLPKTNSTESGPQEGVVVRNLATSYPSLIKKIM